jgi:hypothetical protein
MDEDAARHADPAGDSKGQPPPVQPYDLAPLEPVAAATPPRIPTGRPVGAIAKPGLLSDFDEDADFDKDPELERATKGAPQPTPGRAATAEPATPGPNDLDQRIVVPGRGTVKTILIVGAAVAFAAAIAAAINAAPERNRFFVALSMLFDIALHTVTGVGAIGLAAAMLGKLLRSTELAGARMLVATSLFALGFQLDFQSPAHTLGLGLAAGTYFLAVWLLFKLKAQQTVVVAAFHFALWILFFLHHQVSMWAAPAAKAIQAVAPAAG